MPKSKHQLRFISAQSFHQEIYYSAIQDQVFIKKNITLTFENLFQSDFDMFLVGNSGGTFGPDLSQACVGIIYDMEERQQNKKVTTVGWEPREVYSRETFISFA